MKGYQFEDTQGTFHLKKAENISYLYFPIAGEAGLKSSLTPNLGGDAKIDQNTFLLEPVSAENLVNNRNSRNFWCNVKGIGSWSLTGNAAEALSKKFTEMQDDSEVTAGFMWQKTTRESKKYQLRGEILSFIPVEKNVEVMLVTITNTGRMAQTVTPTAAIPLYGRSADNIRDHRHVTSLLHRIETTDIGVLVTPTLSFDERGHQVNHMTYYCVGWSGNGEKPVDFYPTAEDFVGEGGNFERPYAIVKNAEGVKAGTRIEGLEAVGGLHFSEVTLEPEEECSYLIFTGITEDIQEIRNLSKTYTTREMVLEELEKTKAYWQEKVNVAYHTGDSDFNQFMHWVSFQPILRRIYGCSFLPHHDYGKGGRGWRDLWQDCLALLIMNPDGVRQMLLDNFAGVRVDGSNATIIGSKQGEFVADRNHITRVWMDHGVWPMITTKFYIDQTGDLELLEKEAAYFKDKQIARGTRTDTLWDESYGCWQKTKRGVREEGTILEHLLLQNLTAFYEVGEHNNIRLRGADWNDALNITTDPEAESVMLSHQFCLAFRELKLLMEKIGETDYAEFLKKEYDTMRKSINEKAWDGEWYMRALSKKENIGSRTSEGSKIYLNAQTWAVLGDVVDEEKLPKLLTSVDSMEHDFGFPLNMPPYEKYSPNVGRMSGMLPGLFENGGVYCHATGFKILMDCKLGRAEKALCTLKKIMPDSEKNPSTQSGAEPYVFTNCYSTHPKYYGKSYWSWTTGTSAWCMKGLYEGIMGVKRGYDGLEITPCFPKEWERAEMTRHFRNADYHIVIENPQCRKAVTSVIIVDGTQIKGNRIPDFADNKKHEIKVILQ